jgi:hypothetical protein
VSQISVSQLQATLTCLGRDIAVDNDFRGQTLARAQEQFGQGVTKSDALAKAAALRPQVQARVDALLSKTEPLTSDEVRDLQAGLVALNYNPGPVDGDARKLTGAAVSAYLASKPQGRAAATNPTVVAALGHYDRWLGVASAPSKSATPARSSAPAQSAPKTASTAGGHSCASHTHTSVTPRKDTLPERPLVLASTAAVRDTQPDFIYDPLAAVMPKETASEDLRTVSFDLGHGVWGGNGKNHDCGASYYYDKASGRFFWDNDLQIKGTDRLSASKMRAHGLKAENLTLVTEEEAINDLWPYIQKHAASYGIKAEQAKRGTFEERATSNSHAEVACSLHFDVGSANKDLFHIYVDDSEAGGRKTYNERTAAQFSSDGRAHYKDLGVLNPTRNAGRELYQLYEVGNVKTAALADPAQREAFLEAKAHQVLQSLSGSIAMVDRFEGRDNTRLAQSQRGPVAPVSSASTTVVSSSRASAQPSVLTASLK